MQHFPKSFDYGTLFPQSLSIPVSHGTKSGKCWLRKVTVSGWPLSGANSCLSDCGFSLLSSLELCASSFSAPSLVHPPLPLMPFLSHLLLWSWPLDARFCFLLSPVGSSGFLAPITPLWVAQWSSVGLAKALAPLKTSRTEPWGCQAIQGRVWECGFESQLSYFQLCDPGYLTCNSGPVLFSVKGVSDKYGD